MNSRFLPEADAEFREAARYYEDRASGLGLALLGKTPSEIIRIPGGSEAAPECRFSIHGSRPVKRGSGLARDFGLPSAFIVLARGKKSGGSFAA
jgi:hypothetical protein